MDICRIWLTAHCKEYKRGTCDLIHIKDFCQNGIECKDKACLEGLQKRHVHNARDGKMEKSANFHQVDGKAVATTIQN